MAATLHGKVAVYGIDGTLAYTGMVKTANILKSTSLTQTYREAELIRQGIVTGKAADVLRRQASFTFVPYDSGGSPTLATAKTLVVVPTPLALITIADYSITIFDGTWNAVGAVTVTPNEEGFLEISITGEQVWNGSAYASLAAAA